MQVGELKGTVIAQAKEIKELKDQLDAIEMKLNVILESIAQTKGGWKTIIWLASIFTTVGAVLTKLWHILSHV